MALGGLTIIQQGGQFTYHSWADWIDKLTDQRNWFYHGELWGVLLKYINFRVNQ